MFQKYTAYCLILMMAMNGLLATAGGAVLCLHDHNFGHVLADVRIESCEEGSLWTGLLRYL